jgi:hypothetical protein
LQLAFFSHHLQNYTAHLHQHSSSSLSQVDEIESCLGMVSIEGLRRLIRFCVSGSSPDSSSSALIAALSNLTLAIEGTSENEKKTMVASDDVPEWKHTLEEYCENTLPLLSQFNAEFERKGRHFRETESTAWVLTRVIAHALDFPGRATSGLDNGSPAEKTEMFSGYFDPAFRGQECDLGFPSDFPILQQFKYQGLFFLLSTMVIYNEADVTPTIVFLADLLFKELIEPARNIGIRGG